MKWPVFGIALMLAACAHVSAAPNARFQPTPCVDVSLEGRATCGRVSVPENYAHPEGRQIALYVMILPASGARTGAAPLYYIDGGPGSNGTSEADRYLGDRASYRRNRDVVLVDQRGTGQSSPLHCPEISNVADPYAPMYLPGAVARCRDQLMAVTDVTQYTTEASARDLDRVLDALGHRQIDIIAASYGTTLAMHYMSRSPQRVRSAVLIGAAPAWARPPEHHATVGARALRLVMAECEADAACHQAFPDLAGDLRRALARLPSTEASPLPEIFMEDIRRTLYSARGARRVPLMIHSVAEHGLPPAEAPTGAPEPPSFAEGLYIQISCAESFARMDYEAAAAEARATPLGDYRLRFQRQSCRDWAPTPPPARAPDPSRAHMPVLFIAGNLDPVTSPEWSAREVQRYPHARRVVIPEGRHTNGGLSNITTCFDPLLQRFYETLDLAALDPSCLADMRPPPFALN